MTIPVTSAQRGMVTVDSVAPDGISIALAVIRSNSPIASAVSGVVVEVGAPAVHRWAVDWNRAGPVPTWFSTRRVTSVFCRPSDNAR